MGAITGNSLVTGGAVDLNAGADISSDGMGGGPLLTAAGVLTVSVTTDNAVIDNDQMLSLGASTVGGDLTIDADEAINITGPITATGALNLTADAGAVTATPVQTVTAASVSVSADGTNGGITLEGLNTAGVVSLNTSGDAVVTNTNAAGLNLGASMISGGLTATADGGALTVDGELTVNGDVDLIAANDVVISAPIDPSTANPTGTVSIAATGGSISGTATVTGGTVDLDAVSGIVATIDATAVSADNTGLANVDITDVSNTDTTVSSLSTIGQTINVVPGEVDPADPADRGINVNKTGSGSLLIAGNISTGNPVEHGGGVNITATDGGVTIAPAATISTGVAGNPFGGGDIDITAPQGSVRVEAGVVFDTRAGAGGTHNLPALGVDADPTVLPGIQLGAGDVRLLGDGLDLFINSTVSQATSITFDAPRNIFVRALIETTGSGGDVTLLADEDAGMEAPNSGAVIFEGDGAINAMGDVTILGSDFSQTGSVIDAVVFSGSGVDRVTATGNVTVGSQDTAPMGAALDLGGNITGGTVTFADPVRLIDNPIVRSTGGDVTFAGTIDSDATTRDLTVNTAGTNIFEAQAGGDSPLGTITTTGGMTQIAADIAGSVIDFQDAVVINHSSVTIDGSTSVNFGSTVSSATAGNNLAVNSPSTTFVGVVGGGPAIGTLMTDADGTTRIAANITANDVQVGDAVVVTGGLGNTPVRITGVNSIAFDSTVDGDQNGMNSLTVIAPTTSFGGDVGNAGDAMAMTPTRLNNLATDSNGTTTISGDIVRTEGNQQYDDTVDFSPAGRAVTLEAGMAVVLSQASGADQLTINAGDFVLVNDTVSADNQISVNASTDGSGRLFGLGSLVSPSLNLTAADGIDRDAVGGGSFAIDTSTVTIASTSGGASVTNAATIELDGVDVAGALSVTATTGDVIFDDDPATPEVDEISADGSATLSAPMGAVTGTAIVESPVVAFNAQDGINDGSGGPVNTESLHISADNAGIGDVRILNSNMDVLTETNVASLSTGSGAIHFNQTGDAATRITGDIITGSGTIDIVAAADITIDPGLGEASTIRSGGTGVDGGNITITSGNSLVFGSGANTSITLDTRDGVDGEFILNPGVTLGNLQREVGAGDITLAGTGFEDLIVDGNLTDDTPFTLSAPGDIIITALIETTNAAAGNIELRANNDAQDGGGVVIRGLGRINSAADVSIFGSDLIESASAAGDGVVIDRPGVGEPADRVTAAGGILVELIDDDGVSGERVELGADLLAQGIHSGSRLDPMIAVDASIRLAAPVTLTGPVTVRSAATDPNNHVVFDSTIDAQTGAASTELTVGVETGGQIRFEDHLGSTAPISGLMTEGTGMTVFSSDTGPSVTPMGVDLDSDGTDDITARELQEGTVNTAGNQMIATEGGVMVEADTGLMSMDGDVMIDSAVTGTTGMSLDVDAGRNVAVGDITLDGGGHLSLQANSGFNSDNSTNTEVPTGVITINSALTTDGNGNIFLGAAGRSVVPTVATINGGNPAVKAARGSREVTINTDGGVFYMGPNEKFTVDGSLTIETEGGHAVLGDLNTVGDMIVDVNGGDLYIRLRDPVENLLPRGQPAGSPDEGVDFVALDDLDTDSQIVFNTSGGRKGNFSDEPIRLLRSTRDQNPPGFSVQGDPLANIDVPKTRGTAGDIAPGVGKISPISEITVDVNPTFFVDFQSEDLFPFVPPNFLATALPIQIDPNEDEEEMTEEVLIGQTEKDMLRQLGIYAEDQRVREKVRELLEGINLIDDLPSDPNRVPIVTTDRIHSGAVVTSLKTYLNVFWGTPLDEDGNLLLDEHGKPTLESQATQIKGAFANAMKLFRNTGREFAPSDFRVFLASTPEVKEAKRYANRLRKLFDQLSVIGITAKELNTAKKIMIIHSGILPEGVSFDQLEQVIGSQLSREAVGTLDSLSL